MAQAEERNLKQSFPRELLDQPPSAASAISKHIPSHIRSWGKQTRKCATRCVNREARR